MPDFRLYFLEDNRIRRAVVLENCPTDDDAIALAETHRDGRAMELWCGTRVVRRFEAKQDA